MKPSDEERTKAPDRIIGGPKVTGLWNGGSASCDLPSSGSITIGRGEECALVLPHGTVSRKHATLRVVSGALTIEDLGSSNGTTVAGRRIKPFERVAIAGASVEVGSVMLIVPQPPTSGLSSVSPMDQVFALVDRVAESTINVLLLGETGVGKGVVAERLHATSPRAASPFMAIHCAAIPETLLESELFGHERGAFTGAVTTKAGLLESANGGTVFLDEIGDIERPTQVKLLRVLESGQVFRLGSRKPTPLDLRFVSATNRDLIGMVDRETFRSDLYYRLNGISIFVPPLRERGQEIVPLAQKFATASLSGKKPVFAPRTISALEHHGWAGNVRELRNVIERAVVLARGGEILPEHLLLGNASTAVEGTLHEATSRAERERIEEALVRAGGNQTRAAALLGISRRTMVRRLEELKLPRPRKET